MFEKKADDDYRALVQWSMLTFQEQEEYRDIQSEPVEGGEARILEIERLAQERLDYVNKVVAEQPDDPRASRRHSDIIGEARAKIV